MKCYEQYLFHNLSNIEIDFWEWEIDIYVEIRVLENRDKLISNWIFRQKVMNIGEWRVADIHSPISPDHVSG